MIGRRSRFATRKWKLAFGGWTWRPGWASRLANFKFQISNFKFRQQRDGKLSLEPSLAQHASDGHCSRAPRQKDSKVPPRSWNFKLQISNIEFPASRSSARGFTLIELMVVLTVLLILATMSMPIFHLAVVHAREAVLKDDLYTLRKLIDEYTVDKQKPPTSLDDLVEAGYLRGGIPVDPFTGSNETWQTEIEDVPLSPTQSASGIVDVHSGSDETALDGTAYSSW